MWDTLVLGSLSISKICRLVNQSKRKDFHTDSIHFPRNYNSILIQLFHQKKYQLFYSRKIWLRIVIKGQKLSLCPSWVDRAFSDFLRSISPDYFGWSKTHRPQVPVIWGEHSPLWPLTDACGSNTFLYVAFRRKLFIQSLLIYSKLEHLQV